MATIATLMVKLGLKSDEFTVGLTKAQMQMQTSANKMVDIGRNLTARVTLPIVGIGVASLKSAADFEQSMNILQQVSGATAAEMEALSAQAIQVGKDSVFSAGEVAKAQLELAKAGLEVNQVMGATNGVIALAAAADTDLANAALITASTLNAFHLEAGEAGRVADLLAAAANASSANITDLMYGLRQGGFAFSTAGQGVDDLATSLAILTNVGLTGTDAGTALKNMFMRLFSPTDKAANRMKGLGIAVWDAQGNMLPLVDIIDNLNTAMAGMTDEARLDTLETIFLSDGMKAMIPLLDQGRSGFEAMRDQVNEAGAASDTANARMKGLAGAVEYFKGTLDTLMISAGTPWLVMLADLIRGAADLIAKFGELPAPVQKGVVVFLAAVAVLGPLLILVGSLITAISTIVGAFAAAPAVVAPVTAALGTFGGSVGAVTGVLGGGAGLVGMLGTAGSALLAFATGPIGLTIAAVAGLALAYKTNFLGIRDATNSAVSWIGNQLNGLRDHWATHSGELNAIVENQWVNMHALFALKWEGIRGITTAGMQFMQGDWEGGLETLRNTASNMWGMIREIYRNQLDNIRHLFTFFGWPELGENIARGIGQGITNGLRWIRDAAMQAAQAALDAAQSWLGINSPSTVAADEVGEPFGEGIGVGAGRAIDDIMGMLGSRLDALVGGLQPTPGFAGDGVGAGGGMTIQVTQNFYGNADAATVEGASRNGVVAALRQVGVR